MMFGDNRHTDRRSVLKATAGIAALTSVAGCTGGDGGDGGGSDGGGGGSDGGDGGSTGQKTTADMVESFENDIGKPVGANWEAVQELAKEEGQLKISASVDTEDFNTWMEAFPHAGDWDINYVTGDGTNLAMRDYQSYKAGNPSTSMTVGSAGTQAWSQQGVAMELSADFCPQYGEYDDKYKTPHMLAARLKCGAIFANTDMVDDPQAALEDGWMSFVQNDRWTGDLGWDPTPLWQLMASFRQAYGDEFFDHLKQRKPVWVDSHTDLARFVAAGRFSVAHTYADKVLDVSPEETPMEVVTTAPMPASGSGGGLATFAPAPNRGLILLNWLNTDDGQKQMAKTHQSIKFGLEGWPPSQDWPIGEVISSNKAGEEAKQMWQDKGLGAGAAGA